MTYEKVRATLDENGRLLLDKLDIWAKDRRDIVYDNTKQGFNVCLNTEKGLVTIIVVWGQLNQKESFAMESRQHEYPEFMHVERADRLCIQRALCNAYFQKCEPKHMNARLEFRLIPPTADRHAMIVGAIDTAANILKARYDALR